MFRECGSVPIEHEHDVLVYSHANNGGGDTEVEGPVERVRVAHKGGVDNFH